MPQRFGTTIAANRARLDAVEQLAQIHRWDPRTSDEETFSALTDLQRAGKIRYFGSSTSRPTGAACCESEAKSRPERRGH
jgi:aryl-alcohol dehydrogenase-like predicted oxidoreductase